MKAGGPRLHPRAQISQHIDLYNIFGMPRRGAIGGPSSDLWRQPGDPVGSDWPTAKIPWSAIDLDHDPAITSGAELFGSSTLVLWADRNRDRRSSPDELAALAWRRPHQNSSERRGGLRIPRLNRSGLGWQRDAGLTPRAHPAWLGVGREHPIDEREGGAASEEAPVFEGAHVDREDPDARRVVVARGNDARAVRAERRGTDRA